MRRRLALAAAVLGVLVLGASGSKARADGDAIDALLAGFAGVPGLEASFREERFIAMLAAPLVAEGTVHYERPGRFAKHTSRPARTSLVVDGVSLQMGTAAKPERLAGGATPFVRQFLDAYLALVEGSRPRLEAAFALSLTGAVGDRWTLELTPKDARLRALVRRIRFTGLAKVVERLEVEEGSGDRAVTHFSGANTAKRFTDAERARIFRLP